MTFVANEFLHHIVYWAPCGSDGMGGRAYENPIKIRGLYERTFEPVAATSGQGVEVESNDRVHVTKDLRIGGLLLSLHNEALRKKYFEAESADKEVSESTFTKRNEFRRYGKSIVKFDKVPGFDKYTTCRIAYC